MYKIPATTLFTGKNLIFVPECHSTNSLAQQLSQHATTTEGSLVITDNQTAGRGQRGNAWDAEPGKNFTFSLLLKPSFLRPSEQFNLTIAVSLAVAAYLESKTHHEVKIKWPNDVLIDNKKVCGILIENQLQGAVISYSIIGVGLNMNQTSFRHERAASLKTFSGREYVLADELEGLLSHLEQKYLLLRQQNRSALLSEYYRRLLGMNEERRFQSASGEFNGTIKGIDPVGKLRIESNGSEKVFDLKEVSFL